MSTSKFTKKREIAILTKKSLFYIKKRKIDLFQNPFFTFLSVKLLFLDSVVFRIGYGKYI